MRHIHIHIPSSLSYQTCALIYTLFFFFFFLFFFFFAFLLIFVAPALSFQAFKPMSAMPAKIPKGKASPLGLILVAAVNSEPETKGPAARPAAESV
jgi:hypothetical protein